MRKKRKKFIPLHLSLAFTLTFLAAAQKRNRTFKTRPPPDSTWKKQRKKENFERGEEEREERRFISDL